MSKRPSASSPDRADPSTWPTVAWPALPIEQQAIFQARAEAVRRYCRREHLRNIEKATGVSYSTVRRFYLRCLEPHPDGRMQGFRALIPFERVKAYQRLSKIARSGPAGKAGAFAQLLQRHPELESLIACELTAHRVVVSQGRKGLVLGGLNALLVRFRQKCLELGLSERDYPLVQKQQGIRSLAAATKSMATRTFESAARAALADKRSGGVRPDVEGLPLAAASPYVRILA